MAAFAGTAPSVFIVRKNVFSAEQRSSRAYVSGRLRNGRRREFKNRGLSKDISSHSRSTLSSYSADCHPCGPFFIRYTTGTISRAIFLDYMSARARAVFSVAARCQKIDRRLPTIERFTNRRLGRGTCLSLVNDN